VDAPVGAFEDVIDQLADRVVVLARPSGPRRRTRPRIVAALAAGRGLRLGARPLQPFGQLL